MPDFQNGGPKSRSGAPVDRIEARLDELGARHQWDKEEIDVLKEMIALWRGFKAIAFVFGSLKQIGIWVAIMGSLVVAVRLGLLNFLGIGPQQ